LARIAVLDANSAKRAQQCAQAVCACGGAAG
jgi:hypothetical protein